MLSGFEYPASPSNLRGTFKMDGVFLAWDYNGVYNPSQFIDFLIIERLNISLGTWSILSNMPIFVTGNSYVDTSSKTAGIDYYYRIKIKRQYTTGEIYESYYTPTVTVQGIFLAPNRISTLTARSGYPDEVELNWSNADNINASGYNIYRRAIGLEDYQLIATVGQSQFNYIDHDAKIKGHEYSYYVTAYNSGGSSQPIYDIVYAPYRKKTDKLVITSFTLNNHHNWEDWADGYPEFEISTAWRLNATSTETLLDKSRERINVRPLIGMESAYNNRELVTYWEISNPEKYYTLIFRWGMDR